MKSDGYSGALTIGLFQLSLASALLLASLPANASFSRSCWDIGLVNDAWLHASCRRADDSINPQAETFLPSFIANINGTLKWLQNGGYDQTCQNCSIELKSNGQEAYLECDCRNNQGTFISTDIRLTARIGNINGDLMYDYTPPAGPHHDPDEL